MLPVGFPVLLFATLLANYYHVQQNLSANYDRDRQHGHPYFRASGSTIPNKATTSPTRSLEHSEGTSSRLQQQRQEQQEQASQTTMDYEFSSRDYVLKHGFPRTWGPCALERVLQTKRANMITELEVVVLGGSASARPGNNCTTTLAGTNIEDLRSGRYSSLLQQRFDDQIDYYENQKGPTIRFQIQNRAQGAQTSTTNALLLDEMIDPNTADVVIWEFLLNGKSFMSTTKVCIPNNLLECRQPIFILYPLPHQTTMAVISVAKMNKSANWIFG